MQLTDFDFDLPAELIAHAPSEKRDHSRLMIVDRAKHTILHDHFYNLPKYLSSTDLVVFNQSKVFPARLYGKKATGGKVEILLLTTDGESWDYLSKPGLKDGQTIEFAGDLRGVVHNDRLVFDMNNDQLKAILDTIGHTPLPPYIDPSRSGHDAEEIRRRYQTIYAKQTGSVAAPTAGLHFTQEVLDAIPNKTFITLHVGPGTFQPVKSNRIEDHRMHAEHFEIPTEALRQLVSQRSSQKRIIGVGTTSVRTLETWGRDKQAEGETDIFIYPGFQFQVVGGMITNFHLPKSTLLMLISAFAGRELIMRAYAEAIKEKYRFYSFGDAMLIL